MSGAATVPSAKPGDFDLGLLTPDGKEAKESEVAERLRRAAPFFLFPLRFDPFLVRRAEIFVLVCFARGHGAAEHLVRHKQLTGENGLPLQPHEAMERALKLLSEEETSAESSMRQIRPIWHQKVLGTWVGQRYHLKGLLGTGSTGAVFWGTDVQEHRTVAIKILSPSLHKTPRAVQRFEREARLAATASQRGVVTILDHGVDQEVGPYIVMEFLRGESLATYLAHQQRLEAARAVAIAVEMLRTLAVVHGMGIVHRDLKPGNVFLARDKQGDETVKLLDFGISRFFFSPFTSQLTAPGVAIGTPRYMAPEQAEGVPTIDHRADLYAVGAILYEALSGTQPYAGYTHIDAVQAVLNGPPVPIRELAPQLELGLCGVVEKAMSRDRRKRFLTAQAMATELQKKLAG